MENLSNLTGFFKQLKKTSASNCADLLEKKTRKNLQEANHGDFADWLKVLTELPDVKPSKIDLKRPAIQIGFSRDLTDAQNEALKTTLKKLHPWRKGPFDIFGVSIDTEWKSHLKWERVERAIQPLAGRTVLDLGCGNGYYLWRMAGLGVKLALGIDPALLFMVQFEVLQKYIQDSRIAILPLGVEDLPADLTGFDTVFSMGLLYHRRDPIEHLQQIYHLLRAGGEAVLETLVIDGYAGEVLNPGERYAKMRNVWNIPSCATAENWLKQAGFKNIRCVDVSTTSLKEQRKTEWMTYESLQDFLDPKDHSKTIEGLPAPKRAVFTAEKK